MRTEAIKAKEAKFTPSSKTENTLEFLIFGIRGFRSHTNKNDGKKIPTVAAIAPGKPFIRYPINPNSVAS